jgi:CHAD domain-containing protein
MTKKSAHRLPSVGRSLRASALSILTAAQDTLADRTIDDSVAIHEVRKALKRWRALLRLLAFALGDEAKHLRRQARDLARSVGNARDAQSALDALADLVKHAPEGALPQGAYDVMRAPIDAARRASERTQLTDDARRQIAAALAKAAATVENWPATIRFADLADALTKSYRRGRRLVPEDWSQTGAEALHELRQRTVELRHQLEFVAALLPPASTAAIVAAQRLRTRLGKHQDLTLIPPLCAPGAPLTRWRSRLAPLIEARQSAHAAAAEKLSRRLFARQPKTFRKKLEDLHRRVRAEPKAADAKRPSDTKRPSAGRPRRKAGTKSRRKTTPAS